VKTVNKKGLEKWFGCFWFFNHSLRWFLVVPPKDGFTHHDDVWPMAQWHSYSILHHIMMSTKRFDTMDACFEWKLSQYSPIMASQCFHCWLFKGKSTTSSKILIPSPFLSNKLPTIYYNVTYPNGCNMHQYWLYLNPPSFIYNAFSFLQDYMAKHCHFLMFVACEKIMAKTSMYQDNIPSIT
jgi:hypothetical protein